MSHFFIGVIVDDPETVDKKLEELMAPYNENIKESPYQVDCYCVGLSAKKDIQEKLDEKFGDIEEIRTKFWEEIENLPQMKDKSWRDSDEGEKYIDNRWKEIIKSRQEAEKLMEESHPDIEKADIKCEECNGTGKRTTTYNKKSKWDWYVIGGRWDGSIIGIERKSSDNGFNFGAEHRIPINNIISVKTYLASNSKPIPFAILTPDGEWIERGQMGWWATVSDEKDKDTWTEEVIKIVSKYPNHFIVGVDCHI